MRVLISTNANLGHFLPLVPLAQQLRRRGHDVVVATEPAFAETVHARGLEHVGVGRDLTLDDIMGVLPDIFEVAPEDQNAYAVPRMFVELRANNSVDDLMTYVAQWQPDVVVRETAEFASWAVAERLGLPHVTVAIGTNMSARDWDAMAGPWFTALGTRVGVADLESTSLYRHLVLSFAPAGFDDWSHTPVARTFRPEPIASSTPLDSRILELDDRPLIYATLGTEFYNADVMRSIIDAVTGNDCNVVATTGPAGNPAEIDPHSPRAVVASWIAQDALLDRAAVVICHGGAGSVGGPLTHGVPLVVLPRGADQFHTAARVAELGAGLMLPGDQQSQPAIATALLNVLSDPKYRSAAQRISEATGRLPGIDDAIQAIERLAVTD